MKTFLYHILSSGKLVLENGDEMDVKNAYHSKKEALDYVIHEVTSKINYTRIRLANTQHQLGKLERVLKVLQKHTQDDSDTPWRI